MFEITRYTASERERWNDFVQRSKNSTFLLERDYMDYHAHRFADASLLVWRKGRLAALLPLSRGEGGVVVSHGGLTYGGLVLDQRATATDVCHIFRCVNDFLRAEGFSHVVYKPTPWIYHRLPAEEDLYALTAVCGAQLVRRELSATIAQRNRIRLAESRRSGLRKARAAGLRVEESTDYATFWHLLCRHLESRYGTQPVHSLEEISRLAAAFPTCIRLYIVYQGETALGGTVVYETPQTAHTQYISASAEGRQMGALDLLFHHLLDQVYTATPYFDFGTSTAETEYGFNASLLFQKEGFGGRGICYDTYEWRLSSPPPCCV